MFNSLSGKTIDTKCSEMIFPEFPKLLFGTTHDGSVLFDATFYILSTNQQNNKNIADFKNKLDYLIQALLNQSKIKEENAFYLNKEGHVLIDISLCYVFIYYVEPDFWVWTNERLNELMQYGIAASDTYIMKLMTDRFSPEVIKDIYKQHEPDC